MLPRVKANAVSMSRNLETALDRGNKLIINESLTTAGLGRTSVIPLLNSLGGNGKYMSLVKG